MPIELLRLMKHLAEMPTHSPESMEQLQELVRMATIRVLLSEDVPYFNEYRSLCGNCANKENCKQVCAADIRHCEFERNFQLRMEEEE